jgi:predicted transcriptional regulator
MASLLAASPVDGRVVPGEFHMSQVKEQVRKLLDELPDTVTLEDIQYHLYVRQQIERGMQDVKDGRLHTQEEVEQMTARWASE